MANETERLARELLAAEYRADGLQPIADDVLTRPFELLNSDEKLAIRAIVAALQQAQQPGAQAVESSFLGWVRRAAIKKLGTDDEVTGVMVHAEEQTDSVKVYTDPPPLPLEPEPDLDERDPKSGELVAQWLFRNGFRELAAVVRAQLDMRAPRKAPPPLPEGVSEEDVRTACWAFDPSGATFHPNLGRCNTSRMRAALESYRARLAAKGGV
jgi:hypothetical protein